MPRFTRKSYKYVCKGLGLANPPDLLPVGQFPILRNVQVSAEGVLSNRPPLALAARADAAASPLLSIRRLNDPTTNTYTRIATDAAGNLLTGITGLTVADTTALLRYVSRAMSKKNQGGPANELSRKTAGNEELRKNINIIAQQAEKVIEQVPLKNLTEYTNFLNVLRITETDQYVPNSTRNQIVKRTLAAFQDEAQRQEMRELSFDQVAKILSDLVHHANYLQPVGARLV